MNVIIRPAMYEVHRLTINLEPALIVTGRLQNESGVIHVIAEHLEPLPKFGLPEQRSHDYH